MEIKPEGVFIEAAAPVGAFYALQTLRQLVMLADAEALPACTIEDWPDFSERGYMLDISRCKVPTMESLRELVSTLALLKYNQFQLYTEHVFAWPGHETVWGMSAPLTPEAISELDSYCREHFIELVPNMNCLGHFERWIAHPEYHPIADHPEPHRHPHGHLLPHGNTLRPDQASADFLGSLMDAYLPCFSSQKAHLGGDEPWDLGKGWSRKLCEERGKYTVYVDYLRAIHQHAKRHAEETLFWADVVLEDPECVKGIPEGMSPVIWGYEPDSPYAEQCALIQSTGLRYRVAPSVRGYCSLIGNAQRWPNLPLSAAEGMAHGAHGSLVTEWGDSGHHQMHYVTLPGLLWGGALMWDSQAHQEEPALAEAINAFIARDSEGTTGQAVIALARVRDLFSVENNYFNPLHRMLIGTTETMAPWVSENVQETEWSAVREALEACASLADGARPTSSDAAVLEEELALSSELALIALERGRHLIAPSSATAVALRRRLAPAIGRYETLWIRRNEVGGLCESANYLRAVFSSLAKDVK